MCLCKVRKVTAIDGANLVRSPSALGMAARRWQRVVNNVADAGDNVFASGCTPSNAMSFRANPLSVFRVWMCLSLFMLQ
eukprot:scaffold29814_cov112-Isochrysis_galbana.AAC.3